ncbi:MAG: Mrp/NBP35 family ATP-binding protein [Ignavibacteria bacterium]|nr:Mrp/NBP35 family ATP-binding protein [Ignavibacteria bacterium]
MSNLNGSTNGTHTASDDSATPLNPNAIRSALENVLDPDLQQTLGALGAIHNVEFEVNTVRVYLILYAPLHFAAERINNACKDAVQRIAPQARVEILVQEKMPERPQNRPLANVKHLIAVASGKGGVGKSTIAANLAAALARKGAVVGLIDADIHGPSVPTMFDLEEEELRGTKNEQGQFIGHPMEKYGVKLVSMGFVMARDQAAIMRGPMQAGYLNTFIEQIEWGALDFLIFDLPPGTGDIQLTMAQRVPLTGAVIVTTPQNLALADVRRGISMFNRVNIPTLGVIENMSYYVLPDGSRDYIFGQGGGEKIAKEMNAPFLGEVPLNINIRKGGDDGMPVVMNDHAPLQQRAIMELAEKLASEVRRRSAAGAQAPTVQISI